MNEWKLNISFYFALVIVETFYRQSLQEPRHQLQSVQSDYSQQSSPGEIDTFSQPER